MLLGDDTSVSDFVSRCSAFPSDARGRLMSPSTKGFVGSAVPETKDGLTDARSGSCFAGTLWVLFFGKYSVRCLPPRVCDSSRVVLSCLPSTYPNTKPRNPVTNAPNIAKSVVPPDGNIVFSSPDRFGFGRVRRGGERFVTGGFGGGASRAGDACAGATSTEPSGGDVPVSVMARAT